MRRNSANDGVQSFVWWPEVDEDVLKRFSIPNYLQFGPNWVKNGHKSPELQKLMRKNSASYSIHAVWNIRNRE